MNFEVSIVDCFNRFYADNNIRAVALRLERSSRFSAHPCDVLSDTPNRKEYYFGIEAKSLRYTGQGKLHFSSHFQNKGKQLDRMMEFLDMSGRDGYLAVQLEDKKNKTREAYLLDIEPVYSIYQDGEPGIKVDFIRGGAPFIWKGQFAKGHYIL